MPLYAYKAKDKKGKVIEDVIQAVNKKEAASAIKSDGYQVLTLKSIDKGLDSVVIGGISIAEKASFCRFMATMLRAGLPLPEAIEIIRSETKNKKLKKIIYDLSFEVKKGKSLSSVLSKYKKDFDPVFLTMIKAGEESGSLDKSFDYLSKQLLAAHELTQKIKGALTYPMIIIAAMFGNFGVMIFFVLPRISEVFSQLDVAMPPLTRLVLTFGNFVGGNLLLVLGITVLIGFLFIMLFVIRSSRQFIFNLFLRLPVISTVADQIDIARFSRTLSTLLKNGVPIMVALDVSTDLLRQQKYMQLSKKFSEGVSGGKSISEVLSEGKGIFPSTVTQTIKAGEKSGSLEVVLEEMADFYEKEVDYSMKRLTSLLEPMLMLIVGLAVGAMVVIMITPIYSIVSGFEA